MERKYIISTGTSRTCTNWQTKVVTWTQLLSRLANCVRTVETMDQYKAMSNEQRGKIKDLGGFVGGALNDGHRKSSTVVYRSLITLDIDYGTDLTIDTIRDVLYGTAWCIYSTHSHTPEAPRYRLIIPLAKTISPDEYQPVARRVAANIGIDQFDDSTYQVARLMYWPSKCKDAEYVYEVGEGAPLDPDGVLATYIDWHDVSSWPMSSRMTRAGATMGPRNGRKQEDPTTKPGIIGAFCRCYNISEAIDTYLPGVYEQCSDGRYTYAKGSTKGGAVVYDNKWLYSHHGTDPCCEREVNAFDLVRLHKYADLDIGHADDMPVNRLPSYKAMQALIANDNKVQALMTREKITPEEDFAGIEQQSDLSWSESIRVDKHGLVATHANYKKVLECDPRICGKIRYNKFTSTMEVTSDLPWRKHDTFTDARYDHEGHQQIDVFTNADIDGLVCWASEAYSSSRITKNTMIDALNTVAQANSYHPIKDYFEGLPAWDGTPRIDTLLTDYLGASDTPLTRAMIRKQLVAAVARIYRPGIKYDYVLTLVGPEGTGKSSLLRALGMQWFSDSFSSADLGSKDSMEQLRGAWIIEMGELKDYNRSTTEAFKAFISKTADDYRPAYGRVKEHYERQCVFFASTNINYFLKGDTGNRRFWPVNVAIQPAKYSPHDIDSHTIDQIWAEALALYCKGEPLYLPASLEESARLLQSEHNDMADDSRLGVLDEALRRPVPVGWYSWSKDARTAYMSGRPLPSEEQALLVAQGNKMMRRQHICAREVAEEIFGQPTCDRYKMREYNELLRRLLKRDPTYKKVGDTIYGAQRRFDLDNDFYMATDK